MLVPYLLPAVPIHCSSAGIPSNLSTHLPLNSFHAQVHTFFIRSRQLGVWPKRPEEKSPRRKLRMGKRQQITTALTDSRAAQAAESAEHGLSDRWRRSLVFWRHFPHSRSVRRTNYSDAPTIHTSYRWSSEPCIPMQKPHSRGTRRLCLADWKNHHR